MLQRIKLKRRSYDNSQIVRILNQFEGRAGVHGGKSLRKLAARTGIGEATLRQMRNPNRAPRIDTLYALANALDMSVIELLGEDEPYLIERDRYRGQLDQINNLVGRLNREIALIADLAAVPGDKSAAKGR